MMTPKLPFLGQSLSTSAPISLYNAKMAKKQSEEDLQKIQNRISLLKTEQLKLARKIQSSDQKALDLYTSKKINDQSKQLKLKEKLEAPLPFTYPLHIKQREILVQIKETAKFRKHQEAQILRYENRDQVSQAKAEQKKHLDELRFKAQDIKDKEISSAQLISQKLRDRRDKVRSDVFFEADVVLNEKQSYDQMIKQLEQDELNALKSLQQTQTMHKNISEKLQLAQQLSPHQFASKYYINVDNKNRSITDEHQIDSIDQSIVVTTTRNDQNGTNLFKKQPKVIKEQNKFTSKSQVQIKSDLESSRLVQKVSLLPQKIAEKRKQSSEPLKKPVEQSSKTKISDVAPEPITLVQIDGVPEISEQPKVEDHVEQHIEQVKVEGVPHVDQAKVDQDSQVEQTNAVENQQLDQTKVDQDSQVEKAKLDQDSQVEKEQAPEEQQPGEQVEG